MFHHFPLPICKHLIHIIILSINFSCNIQSLDKIPICKKNKQKHIHHIRQHLKCLSTFLECGFVKIAFILKCQNLSKTFSMTIDISLQIRKVAFM